MPRDFQTIVLGTKIATSTCYMFGYSIAAFSFFFAVQALQGQSHTNIIQIGQIHLVDGIDEKSKQRMVPIVGRSQFEVAKTLLEQGRDALVVEESLYEDWTPESYNRSKSEKISLVGAAEMIFPKGIPSKFSELNALQVDFLAEFGAARTLFLLGKLSRVHRSLENEEVSNQIDDQIGRLQKKYGPAFGSLVDKEPEIRKWVFDEREKAALQQAIRLGKTNPEKTVYLIFGDGHDFTNWQAEHPELKISRQPVLKNIRDAFHDLFNEPEEQSFRHGYFDRAESIDGEVFESAHSFPELEEYFEILEFSDLDQIRKALRVYGNVRRITSNAGTLDKIKAERTRMVDFIVEKKLAIDFSVFMGFDDPQDLLRLIPLIDPKSVKTDPRQGNFDDFKWKIGLHNDPILHAAFNNWARKNGFIATRQKNQESPVEEIDSIVEDLNSQLSGPCYQD